MEELSDLQDRIMEINQSKQQTEIQMKNKSKQQMRLMR